MVPSDATSTPSALGLRGRPGMVVMAPASATRKPAPAQILTSLMVILKPRGRFSSVGPPHRERWVLATHTRTLPNTSASARELCQSTVFGYSTSHAPLH